MADMDFNAILRDAMSDPILNIAQNLQDLGTLAEEVAAGMTEGFDGAANAAEALSGVTDDLMTSLGGVSDTASAASATFAELAVPMDDLAIASDTAAMAADQLGVALDGALGSEGGVAAISDEAAAALDTLAGSLDSAAASDEAASGAADQAAMSYDAQLVSVEAMTAAQEGLLVAIETSVAALDAESGTLGANAAAEEASTAATDANVVAKEESGKSANVSAGQFGMIGMAAAAAGAGLIIMGAQSEDALSKVQGMAGATTDQINTFRDDIQTMAPEFGKTTKDMSQGLYYVYSAGYQGADALTVLNDAATAAAGGGADMKTVADGLTSSLNAYGGNAKDAGAYTDMMVQAVVSGKQDFQSFSSAIGVAAVTGKGLGISFAEVASGEATLTQTGLQAHKATMDLDFMMRAVATSTDKTAGIANNLGISFDKAKYNTLDLMGKLTYLRDISGDNNEAFSKLVGGANGVVAANILLSNSGKTYNSILDDMHNKHGQAQHALDVHRATLAFAAEQMSANLSVLADKFTLAVKPALTTFLHGLGGVFHFLTDAIQHHGDIAMPILSGVAIILGGALLGAVMAFLPPITALVSPIVLIVVGAVALGIAFKEMYDHIKPVHAVVDGIGKAFKETLGDALHFITLAWNTSLKPAWTELQKALAGAGPLFAVLAALMGGPILSAIGVVIGAVMGLVAAFGGIMRMLAGVIEFLSGFIQFFIDLFTGHFDKLGGDLLKMWNGIVNIFLGAFQTIIGAVLGFVTGIIDWFKHLFDKLIGHSIVTDLISGIIGLFLGMPGKILGAMAGFVGNVLGHFGDMAKGAISHVTGMVSGVVGLFTGQHEKTAAIAAIQKDKIALHADQQKIMVINSFEMQQKEAIKHMEQQRDGILLKASQCKDEHQKIALLHQAQDLTNGIGMRENAIKAAQEQKEKVVKNMRELKEDATKHMKELHDNGILGAFADLPGKLGDIGGQMLAGLGNALKDPGGTLKNIVGSLAGGVVSGFKNIFGIHSPSTVFHEMGTNLIHGLTNGIQAQSSTAEDAMKNVLSSVGTPEGSGARGMPLGGSSNGFGASGDLHIHLDLPAASTGMGLALLNPTDRARLIKEIAQGLGEQIALQGKLPFGFAGR